MFSLRSVLNFAACVVVLAIISSAAALALDTATWAYNRQKGNELLVDLRASASVAEARRARTMVLEAEVAAARSAVQAARYKRALQILLEADKLLVVHQQLMSGTGGRRGDQLVQLALQLGDIRVEVLVLSGGDDVVRSALASTYLRVCAAYNNIDELLQTDKRPRLREPGTGPIHSTRRER